MAFAIKEKELSGIMETFNLKRMVLLAAAALVLRAFFIYETPLVPLQIGDQVPEFNLELFDGGSVDSKKIIGVPHVLFFFANWCPCANLSAPFIKRAFEDYSPKGIKFLGVGFQDAKDNLASFVERHKLSFASGADTENEAGKAFGIGTPPTTVFLNSKGKIEFIFAGKIRKYEELTTRLEKLF